MIEKQIESIELADLIRLRDNGVGEGRSLEYKQALPGGTDDERKEFLADVSSFANAVGGDLLYGVTEARDGNRNTGVPASVDGLAGVAQDAEGLRLEQMMRDGIAPRLPGVRLLWIAGAPNGPVLLIRIPRSWAGPHMVTYKQHSRFYSRNSSGKSALDVFELRSAFLNSGSLAERAKEFRSERIGRLVAGDAPVRLASSYLIALHVIPHSSLAGATSVDLLKASNLYAETQPMYASGQSTTFNIDGVLSYAPIGNGQNTGYLQVFRDGTIETVNSSMMMPVGDGNQYPAGVPSGAMAQELFKALDRARKLLRELSVEPPASVLVTLIGVKGLPFHVSQRLMVMRLGGPSAKLDRDVIMLPDLTLQTFDGGDIRLIVKPILDALWQAAGFARCLDYGETGAWQPLN